MILLRYMASSELVCFWCGLVSFDVICIFFGGNQCFLVGFGCDLVLNDLV